jgi:hypothetical protein
VLPQKYFDMIPPLALQRLVVDHEFAVQLRLANGFYTAEWLPDKWAFNPAEVLPRALFQL